MKITPRKTIVAGELLSVNVRQRLAIFCALLLLTLSLAFALSSLASDFWIRADSMLRNGTQSRHNQMNSGLFYGVRQLDWAFGPMQRIFSVFDELQSGVGFMDRHIWFGILLFLGLGLIWNFVGIFVALRNATLEADDKHARTALGPWGLCLWALLGAISYGTSLTLFQLQFQSRMRVNVLLPEELAAGFSSENCVFYGFSYFLGCSAMTVQVIVLFILFCAYRFGNCGKRKAEEEAQPPIDDSVFIY